MPKELVHIEVVQEGDERFIVKTFADGSDERVPIVSCRKDARGGRTARFLSTKAARKGFDVTHPSGGQDTCQ
jgi:hypothetical protein